ncbi:MAG: ABC transporter ATP-binding protein [Anaerocolumna aminovalerica]|jgi:ATP-binding cassette subfamily B multidrug efflux pump|uniref:ABC transporter ATP-binding protein n=1 Tax=Anaerocolumna aminovalerica TaxID=1527 RepID=UPI00280B4F99|nr:ABC transporter ATP-binding protein [Anaerocolumna aminovalerica]MDU6265773.1 ABC transporter ATP-binding protein [Anaerocolumna aminovalerica]
MRKLSRFLKPYTKLLVIGPMFKLFEAILELLLPYFMSKVIDIGVARGDEKYIITMGGIMLLTAIVGICCALACQYSASLVSQGVGTDIRNEMFKHIGTFSNAEMDHFGTSSLINRITGDVNQVQLAVAMLIRLVIRAPFLCIGGLAMAFIIDIKLSIIMLVVLPLFVLILILTMKKTVPLYKAVQKSIDRIGLVLRENLSGVRVIRAFARTDYEKERFANRNKEYSDHAMKVGRISALLNPLTNLVLNFAIAAIIWFGGIRVNKGSMTTGEVIALIGYVTQILAALIVISNLVVIFTKAFASAARVSEVLDTQSTITDNVESFNISDKTMNPAKVNQSDYNGNVVNKGESRQNDLLNTDMGMNYDYIVEFKDVAMSYDKSDNYDIENISFKVKRGDTIGIIGGTGSGKSTIVNLILRLYDVQKGSVLVENKDVREYNLHELRGKIGLVPQKSVLFTGTIAENIRWGKEDATMEEIKRAADIAQASEFIERMPEGYNSKIYRGGTNVSGGQRQRLTIARAMVRRPDILILDDSFNALDYLTDANLRKALKLQTNAMTTFIVTQRASTIKSADQIIVLNDGEIAGIGTHEELLDTCEVYLEICQSQEMN